MMLIVTSNYACKPYNTDTPGLRAKVRVLTQKVGDLTSAYMNYLRCTDTAELPTKVYVYFTIYVLREGCAVATICVRKMMSYMCVLLTIAIFYGIFVFYCVQNAAFESELQYLEKILSESTSGYLVGEQFSLADIAFYPFLERAIPCLKAYKGYDVTQVAPAVIAWYDKCQARPSIKSTVKDADTWVSTYGKYFNLEQPATVAAK
jgi:Glutathione S-transferase, C-terminal domain